MRWNCCHKRLEYLVFLQEFIDLVRGFESKQPPQIGPGQVVALVLFSGKSFASSSPARKLGLKKMLSVWSNIMPKKMLTHLSVFPSKERT